LRLRTIAAAGAIALAAASVSVLPSTAASAAQVSCGSGYYRIDSYPLKRSGSSGGGVLYLYYNSSNGYNCAYTLATQWVGTTKLMGVSLRASSTDADFGKYDWDYYKYFAGPVYAYAPHACVTLDGEVDSPDGTRRYVAEENGVHCG
jgi:hypothetical protein